MPVTVKWYDHREEIIVFRFEGHWTWKEFHTANEEAGAWAAQKRDMIDAIFDFEDASSVIPEDVISTGAELARLSEQLPNQGITVVVSISSWLQAIVQVIITAARTRNLATARSYSNALGLIEAARQKRLLQNQS